MTCPILYRCAVVTTVLLLAQGTVGAQHLENRATGRVNNTGTIRFKSDNGAYRNDAPAANITNAVIEFNGTTNLFTDVSGDPTGATALGATPAYRVPGLVRYKRDNGTQTVVGRYVNDLELIDAAGRTIQDSVFLAGAYTISGSGPRAYNGTFTYDGTLPQIITAESGMSGNIDRYNNLVLRNSLKTVQTSTEVRLSGDYLNEATAPLEVQGDMYLGTTATNRAMVMITNGGRLTTGSGVTTLEAPLNVLNGDFVIADLSDTVKVQPGVALTLENAAAARLVMGASTHLYLLGDYVNRFGALTNATFDATSLVNYNAPTPQVIQATALSNGYGNVRTGSSVKTSSGDVFLNTSLSVNDSNVFMPPYTMHMKVGPADYTSNAEVVGALRRDLRSGTPGTLYRYNNQETHAVFVTVPQELTLNVRGVMQPNAYDGTTDIMRKVTLTSQGDWKATFRVAYKAEDIPATWLPTTSERLLKMYNAYNNPARALKLSASVPPGYLRRDIANSTGLAYVELADLVNAGPDEKRIDTGNDILLRASRDVMRAVASGRWSNPNTWDEGREPEPLDRVLIDGFTVHVGYIRSIDNYTIREAYPDSMASSVVLANSPNSSLLIGREEGFDSFALVPNVAVTFTLNRVSPSMVPMFTMDTGNMAVDGGLVIYPGASYTVNNLILGPAATLFNAGTLTVGSIP
jgi:hypothetical protein